MKQKRSKKYKYKITNRKRYSKKSSEKSQTKRIYRGGNNDNSEAIIFKLSDGPGFFSTFYALCCVYIYAKKSGKKFYIDSSNWKYFYSKGWHDYFNSLTEFDNSTTLTKYYNTWTINTLPIYKMLDHVECIKEIFKLNDSLLKRAESFIKTINGPYKSLYVRRGDKITESSFVLISTADIIKITGYKNDGSNIFIQTDDYTVVEEIKTILPLCKIFTMTEPNSKGSTEYNIMNMSTDQRKKHVEELLVSVQVFLQGKECWTDYRSNVGRFHKMAEFEKVKVYPDEDSTKNISYTSDYKQ